jgi:hypothetical protein
VQRARVAVDVRDVQRADRRAGHACGGTNHESRIMKGKAIY